MFKFTTYSLILVFSLAGCVATTPYQPQQSVSDYSAETVERLTRYKKGEFDKVGQLSGPKIHERNSTRFGEERVEYFLRAFVGGDGSRLVQAYMYVRYTGEWRFYRDAKISGGEPLRFKSIDTEVVSCGRLYNGCLHSETVGAEIPMETLSSVDGAGLRIYFGTKFSNIGNVVEFSPSYVQGFRAKLLEVSSLKTALK